MNNPITIIKDLCDLLSKASKLYKKYFLSPTQKEILRSAPQSGEFHILKADQLAYPIIRAGSMDMGDQNSPESLAKYWEAFKSLCEIGYIEPINSVVFRLTASGLKKASNIKSEKGGTCIKKS